MLSSGDLGAGGLATGERNPDSLWCLGGNGGMGYGTILGDYIRTTVGIHSPILF